MELALRFAPTAGAAVFVVVVLFVARKILERSGTGIVGRQFRSQVIMLAITALGVLLVLLVLPISDSLRGQLLSVIGILLSAAVALSATTLLGNAMAGIMLRVVRNFRMGDFIRVEGHFGRVSERGLVHTEIQNENRCLVTLPNLYLATHPVTVIRSSGTVVSANVSLGYDVPRTRVEPLLIAAAGQAGLEDPFVRIVDLGDFSVTYRISGMLAEVKQFLSARSRLMAEVMDSLHGGGVEIVSPRFMNTRSLQREERFIPQRAVIPAARDTEAAAPEEVLFDKAEEAESIELLQKEHARLDAEVRAAKEKSSAAADDGAKAAVEQEIEALTRRRDRLAEIVRKRLEKQDSEGEGE